MWIGKRVYETLLAGWRQRDQELQRRIGDLEQEVRLLRETHARTAAEGLALERQLRNTILAMTGDTRAAQIRADLHAIELNQLREERGILLDKALAGIGGFKPQIPHIGARTAAPAPPGVSFDDLGTEMAAAHGLIPEADPWPTDWDGPRRSPDTAPAAPDGTATTAGFSTDEDTGAPGMVYTPPAPAPQGY